MEDQIFDDQTRSQMPVETSATDPWFKRLWKSYKIMILAGIGGVLIIAGVLFYFFYDKGNPQPVSQNVLLLIKGPNQINSDNEAEYTITYRNGENADLVGLSMEMLYPTGFKFKSSDPNPVSNAGSSFNLPVLKQGDTGQLIIRGKLSGATGEDKEIRARLQYKLSNFNSEFVVAESAHTVIQAPNLILDINGPVDVVNGQDTTFTLTVTNVSSQAFDNLALELSYPAGFSFISSTVPPSKNNNYWNLNPLATSASQSIEITGSFVGSDREEKLVRGDLGQVINNNFAPQIASTASFRVIPSSLSLAIKAGSENYVKLGDTVSYKLQYMNRGSIGLNSLVIVVTLDSPALDLSRVSASNAIITGNILTWKSATLSSLTVLSPNESGEITFTVPVKSSLSTNLKNQTIKASAIVTSDEINNPTRAPISELKLISDLDLSMSAEYITGANPMKVGSSTTVAVTMLLSNLSNDVTGGEVVASLHLPTESWNNIILPESEKSRLSYDSNSGKITWKLGNIPAFVGKFTPALQATFQLVVTPRESDRDDGMILLGDTQALGTDAFVNAELKSEQIKTLSTSDIDDLLDGGRAQ